MAVNQSLISLAGFSLVSFSLTTLLGGLPAQGQMSSGGAIEGQIIAGVTFEPPGEETLKNSQGGATRDSGYCPVDGSIDGVSSPQSVVPLMPKNRSDGLTVSDHPTFFMYVSSGSAEQIFFTLKDQNEDYYYQKTVSVPEGASIVSVQLPEDAPPLEVGKNYQWTFVMACQMPVRPDSPIVTGWVKRVTPDSVGLNLNSTLGVNPTPSLEMAQLYGSAGVWFDLVKTLADLRHQEPENYTAVWQEFLGSVGLEAIASEPLMLNQN
jgi:hypothetical protein